MFTFFAQLAPYPICGDLKGEIGFVYTLYCNVLEFQGTFLRKLGRTGL